MSSDETWMQPARRVIGRRIRLLSRLRSRADLAHLASVLAVGAAVPALMQLPLPLLGEVLGRRARSVRRPRVGVERLAELVEIAQVVAHPLLRSGCVTRGICLFWFLAPGDPSLRLCFGIGGEAVGWTGHCWLERAGEPLLEREDPRPTFVTQFELGRQGLRTQSEPVNST